MGNTTDLTRLVLDTNVLVAALRSASGAANRLLAQVGARRFVPCVSSRILLEYESALRRPDLVPLSFSQVDSFLDAFLARSLQCDVHFSLRPTLSDPGDEHVLELAVAAQALAIVTYNVRHFLEARRFGMNVLNPAQVLKVLGG